MSEYLVLHVRLNHQHIYPILLLIQQIIIWQGSQFIRTDMTTCCSRRCLLEPSRRVRGRPGWIRGAQTYFDPHGSCSDYFLKILLLLPWMQFQLICKWKELQKELKASEQHRGACSLLYIWDKALHLVEKEKAIERFTRQLLENHWPPETCSVKELMLECEWCFLETADDELVLCPAGHIFCHQRIRTATSVAMGDGKTAVLCMAECKEELNWQQLEKALEPSVLFKLEQKRQAEEVTAAGLERLVACPFWPYRTILDDPHDRVLVCRNPECGKELCQQGKRVSHIPLRCNGNWGRTESGNAKAVQENVL